jgi:hypothetical protein
MKKAPTKEPLTEDDIEFHKKLNARLRKEKQESKAAVERLKKYIAKLEEKEKAGDFLGKDLPYYLQKEWLIHRARELLGLVFYKLREGQEIQLVIYPHEAAKILKKTLRSAQRVLKEIREIHNKPSRVPVTMKEFCDYHHLDEEKVKMELTE